MTSANRSSEPIAYQDADAIEQLTGIADAFLIGERPIARRVDDSVARAGVFGPAIVRRARGYAPGAVATIPTRRPILAVGADLKNTITLVVDGQAFMSQHIGDLDHYAALRAFQETVEDLLSMYEIQRDELLVVHDAHPQYVSAVYALELSGCQTLAVQHHRAHTASVIAERGAWDERVIGVSFDGTGYGDDGSIWGGEIFRGSVEQGFERIAHSSCARCPVVMRRRKIQCRRPRVILRRWRFARFQRLAISFSFALSRRVAIDEQRHSHVHHDLDGAAFRYGRRAAGIHSRDHF